MRVVYLGADLPVDDMAAAVRARGAAALGISIVCREHDDGLARDLSRLRGILPDGVTIFVGGHAAASYRDVLRDLRAIFVTDVRAFRAEMARLVQSHP